MERKRHVKFKLLKSFFALVMMIATVFGMQANVSAADDIYRDGNIYIYKDLEFAEGITPPTATFKFTVTPVSNNGSTSTPEIAKMPAISINDINVVPSDLSNAVLDATTGIKTVSKGHAITMPTFPGAGVYEYVIKETAGTYTATPGTDEMIYSSQEYKLRVYVKWDSNTSRYVIDGYIVSKEEASTPPTEVKIEPGEDGGLRFKNTYKKIAGPDRNGEKVSFYVQKDVVATGEGAGYVDPDQEFTFNIFLKASATETGNDLNKDYAYYIEDVTTGTKVAGSDRTTKIGANTTLTVNLKDKQRVVFVNLPAGTKTYVVETQLSNYTSEGDIRYTGFDGLNKTIIMQERTGVVETTTAGDLLLSAGNVEQADIIIGELENYAKVRNTYTNPSLTGVVLNNLPFIALIVVGVAGLGYVIISKKRRATR